MANGDAPVVLLFLDLGCFLHRLAAAATGRCRDDVVGVVTVAGKTIDVNGDLDEWIRLARRRMANGDLLFRFDLLLDDFSFLRRVLHRSRIAATSRCRDDVVTVIAVTVQAVEVNRDLDVRVGRALRGVADGDLLAL